jgi:hypothetical protein
MGRIPEPYEYALHAGRKPFSRAASEPVFRAQALLLEKLLVFLDLGQKVDQHAKARRVLLPLKAGCTFFFQTGSFN